MNEDIQILMDVNDPDLEGPYSIIISYLNANPNGNETATILSNDEFHLNEDPNEAFEDWNNIMPPKEKIDHLRKHFGVTDIYVEVSLYDAHNCEIATSNFKWEDNE